jgi:hypothetical protein
MADVVAANRRLLEDIRARQLRGDIEARLARRAAAARQTPARRPAKAALR